MYVAFTIWGGHKSCSNCCGHYLHCIGGCSTPPHGDGHCTVDAIHITVAPMGGTNAARQWVPHNYVVVLDRFYVLEDAYLATGILSGCTCEKDSDEANCREVGRRILDKLAHENEDATLNVLPTPKIVATLKKYGYVAKMVESGTHDTFQAILTSGLLLLCLVSLSQFWCAGVSIGA